MKSITESIAKAHRSPAMESSKCSSTSFRDGSPNIQSHHGTCTLPNWQHLEDPVYTNIRVYALTWASLSSPGIPVSSM